MSSILKDAELKDSVFATAADAVSDFETIFDEEDALIEMVEGFGENGESLIGRDPEEGEPTDNSDGKVDMEDSSPSTDFDLEPDAETGKGVIESADDIDAFLEGDLDIEEPTTDETNPKDILEEPEEVEVKDFHNENAALDNLFDILESDDCELGNCCPKCGKTQCTCDAPNASDKAECEEKEDSVTDETNKKDVLEEPEETDVKDFHDEAFDPAAYLEADIIDEEPTTDETNPKDVLEEPEEVEVKDFHNEGAELDAIFEQLEGEDEFEEYDDSFEGMDDDDDIDENVNIGDGHINWFAEADQDSEIDYAEDELIDAADEAPAGTEMNLDYEPGEDDQIIDDVIDGDL